MTIFFSTNNDFVGNLEWKMCLYIVDNVSTCHIIYFKYVNTEKRIDNSPNYIVCINMKVPTAQGANSFENFV